MYHNTCWVNAKKKADKTHEEFPKKDYINALLNFEIMQFIEKEMTDPTGKV